MRPAAFIAASLVLSISANLPAFTADTHHPCELLTEDLVRSAYGVTPGTELEQDDNSSSRFPNCGYRWRVMSEADEEAANCPVAGLNVYT